MSDDYSSYFITWTVYVIICKVLSAVAGNGERDTFHCETHIISRKALASGFRYSINLARAPSYWVVTFASRLASTSSSQDGVGNACVLHRCRCQVWMQTAAQYSCLHRVFKFTVHPYTKRFPLNALTTVAWLWNFQQHILLCCYKERV